MARTVTLASLRSQAQQRADMENTDFLTDAEWNVNINNSATELYDLLTTVFEDYYFQTSSITTTGTDSYPLPASFYKLLGVDQVFSSGQSGTVKPFQFGERNSYRAYSGTGEVLTLSFIPIMPALSGDSDTFDGINGWEEYIVIDAAIKALLKEESDISALMAQKAAITKRINECAPNRDAGMPDRVTDVYAVQPFDEAFITPTIRYRLMGGNIKLVESFGNVGMA
jgi:hypothetical protein